MLLTPRQKNDQELFGKFGTAIDISSTSIILTGPFNFEPRSSITATKAYVLDAEWLILWVLAVFYILSHQPYPTVHVRWSLAPRRIGFFSKHHIFWI